jgi:glucose/arabinose dehydrogenase
MPITIQIPVLAKDRHAIERYLIFIPLALTAFTHLWNPIGFPTFFIDESGYYLPRAMHFLETGNPKDDSTGGYDHPYFGWIFLAGALATFGYPDSLNPSSDTHSIQTLYLYPRILMGMLAILDTFLTYKIAQTRYGTRVALIASILFAVMPLTWITRRILLEPIQLPFLLSSILFAMYSKHSQTDMQNRIKRTITFPLLSGIFMGIAIFTKLPVITMIPLVAFIIYSNTRRNIWIQDRAMLLFLFGSILIPLLWPAHALLLGQLDEWRSGLLNQVNRDGQPLLLSIQALFGIDPVLVMLGIAGLVYAGIRKDFVLLLWALPLLAFLQIIGYVSFFHLIPLFPILCIAASKLAVDLFGRIRKQNIKKIAPFIFVLAVGLFGLINTTLLITQNLTSSFFELYSFVAGAIPANNNDNNNNNNDNNNNNNAARMTVVGNIQYFWIPKYVLDKDQHFYQSYYAWKPVETKDFLIMADRQFDQLISDKNTDWRKAKLKGLYEESHRIALFREQAVFNQTNYPYSGMVQVGGVGKMEIRSNNYSTPIMLEDNGYMLDPVFHGIKFPTSMTFLGPDDILVLEKNDGTVRRIINGTMLPEPVLDVNVASMNERGMLGIAIAKHENGPTYVFLYFTESKTKDGDDLLGEQPLGNRLYRYEFLDGRLENPKLLLDLPATPGPSHNGGALTIGPDGNVYVAVGDLLTRSGKNTTTAGNVQDGNNPDGRAGILRITQEGEVVNGHGILGEEHPLNKYYAYGIRNSFGMDFDPVTGKLWDTENGPNYGDEVNLVEPGFNSGWKKIQGIWRLADRGRPGEIVLEPNDLVGFNGMGNYSQPEFVWNSTAAPTALKFLNSDRYGKQYQNDLFVSDFDSGNVYHFELNQNRTELLMRNGSSLADRTAQDPKELEKIIFTRAAGGITDMELGPDGYLYILSLTGDAAAGRDCTSDRRENCVDYDDSSLSTAGIFKVVPSPYVSASK